jgi:hypothetical protein
MRRRLVLGLVAVAGLVLALAIGALWWLASADRITPGNAARIRPGMTLAAVNQLLGRQGRVAAEALPAAAGENHYVWQGVRGDIYVAFRGDLTVADPAVFRAADSLLARLYNRLGW